MKTKKELGGITGDTAGYFVCICAVSYTHLLALAGYLLQTFFHNPIAGPFVLGISSGAKMVVALVLSLIHI